MNKFLCGALLVGTTVFANQFDIGIQHDGNTVSLGYKVNNNIKIEASTSQYKQTEPKDEFTAYYIGIFKTQSTGEKTSIYYGARIGTQKNEDESGSIIAPTFGFEYFVDSKISFGGDIMYYDRELNDKKGLDSKMVLRYYF